METIGIQPYIFNQVEEVMWKDLNEKDIGFRDKEI